MAIATLPDPSPMNMLAVVNQQLLSLDTEKLDWYHSKLAQRSFNAAFLDLQRHLPEIRQDGVIDMGITKRGAVGVKSRYVTFANLHEVVVPLCLERGLTWAFLREIHGEFDVLVGLLTHIDGYQIRSVQRIIPDPQGAKTAPQADASGESYAKRRLMINMLTIRSRMKEDRDLDGNNPMEMRLEVKLPPVEDVRPLDAAELKALREKIARAQGITEERVCEKYEVEKLEALPRKILSDAHKALDNWIATHG